MARALDAVNKTAVELATGQAALRRNLSDAFVNLGRRNQNLVTRQLEYISEIELKEADPESLEELFRLDHLATRMRRNAESLLILAGSGPARQWSAAVPAMDVARAASAEVEDYKRLRLHHFDPAMMTGAVTTDLVHIMAELVENALTFSPPGSPVDVYGRFLEGGYVIVIVDSGIGMSARGPRPREPPPRRRGVRERSPGPLSGPLRGRAPGSSPRHRDLAAVLTLGRPGRPRQDPRITDRGARTRPFSCRGGPFGAAAVLRAIRTGASHPVRGQGIRVPVRPIGPRRGREPRGAREPRELGSRRSSGAARKRRARPKLRPFSKIRLRSGHRPCSKSQQRSKDLPAFEAPAAFEPPPAFEAPPVFDAPVAFEAPSVFEAPAVPEAPHTFEAAPEPEAPAVPKLRPWRQHQPARGSSSRTRIAGGAFESSRRVRNSGRVRSPCKFRSCDALHQTRRLPRRGQGALRRQTHSSPVLSEPPLLQADLRRA